MREIAHIRATMLGRFALQQTGMKEPRMVSLAGRSGRLWTLVAYLILHRDRGIPAQELIDLLWPDGSGSNPASTLQNNASRARNAMATLGFSDTKGMIRYENGLYRWVPGTDTWLDVDVFEDLARRALETSDPEELRTLGREAADLYQGDFLPDVADELWCADLHAYYRSLFVRLFRRLVQELMRTQEYAEAAALCAQAVHLDPLSEEFNLLLMQNLTRSHQAQQALDHYEALQKLYQESYGLTPSPELEAARLTASQELYGGGMGPAALETFLLAGDGESRALACDNGTFREIVLLYLRSMRRDPDLKAQLLMLCLEGWEAQPEKNAVYMQQAACAPATPSLRLAPGNTGYCCRAPGRRPIAPSLSGSSRRCTSVLPKAAPFFRLGPSICGAWSIWPNPKTDTHRTAPPPISERMDRSMQENRSIAPGLGAFRLTLQNRENGFCGYVYSAALGCRAEFTSLARLIVLLEEWMNTATDSPVPEKPSAAAAPADVDLEVRLRQHYSWQGQLRDLKGGAVFPFHSVLELLLQLEALLEQ